MANDVQDKKAEFSLNLSVIVQSLILVGIVGNVKILLDIKDQLAVATTYAKINETKIEDHERRIYRLEVKP